MSSGNNDEEKQELVISNKYVNSGYWFSLTLTGDPSSNALTLNVNGSQNTTQSTQSYLFMSATTWTFGGLNTSNDSVISFQGCVSKIKINREIISLNVTNQYGLLKLEGGKLIRGCESPDYCASSPCSDSTCVNNWHSYSCVAYLDSSSTLSVGAIAGIVFFCIFVIVIIVAAAAVKKRRTKNQLAAKVSGKTNSAIERRNSGSSNSSSLPSRKTPSRHSFSDSGVDIRNRCSSLSNETSKKTNSSGSNVIPLGSPDEYNIVTSLHGSVSDDRDNGFTESESEYGVSNNGADLVISSIPSSAKNTQPQLPSKKAPLNYNKKVPFLINRGFFKDLYQASTSTSPSMEPESIEMHNYCNDIENAEQYSIGNASFATYSDLNEPSYTPSRYSDDRLRYKPSLERFSESDDSSDERRLNNLRTSFEPAAQVDSSGESSDGNFTSSECGYEQRASSEDEQDVIGSTRTQSFVSASNYGHEMSVDEPVKLDSISIDVFKQKQNSRETISHLIHDDVEIV